MTISKKIILSGLLLGATVFSNTSFAGSYKEAIGFGIDEFSSECGGSDLSHSVEFAEIFKNQFDSWKSSSKWDYSRIYRDTAVDAQDWADASKVSWGVDNNSTYGADGSDVALISGHGYTDGESYVGATMGDKSGDSCSVGTTKMAFGNGTGHDLEIAIFATCHSGSKGAFNGGAFGSIRSASASFNTWLGFHGVSYDSSTDANHLENFMENSYSDAIGDNWLDEMYRGSVLNSDLEWHDECPVAIIFAETDGKADDQFHWAGFNDRFKSGSAFNASYYYYIDGCDPDGANEL